MSTLSRRIEKLETHLQPAAAYVVDSWEDHWRLRHAFLDAGSAAYWQGVRLRMQPHGDLTPEARARYEEERDRLEAATRARLDDTTKPPEERYTYHEALAAGVIRETPAFQAAYAAEEARVEEGHPSPHFFHRSLYLRRAEP